MRPTFVQDDLNTRKEVRLFWMRRDLRLNDSHALFRSLSQSEKDGVPTQIVFIFDSQILSNLSVDDSRVTFIHQSLEQMNQSLLSYKSSIAIYHGEPAQIFSRMLQICEIREVYVNEDYEPSAIKRDEQIEILLSTQRIPLFKYKDQVNFEKHEVTKDDGKPYTVYTPYKKKWLVRRSEESIPHFPSEKLLKYANQQIFKSPSLSEIGFRQSSLKAPPAEFSKKIIESYDQTRDFPAVKGTSHLGVHLRFGTISVRELTQFAMKHNDVFLSELIWREFFMQILFHFPHSENHNFKSEFDRIKWRNNKTEFEKWKLGQTGYPIVDAGMRELVQTGYMHNRVRMIAGSFLCKHLLIDWKWGERFFAEHLFDYELASNVGNWQWVAGTGCDAAPYFRVFNPEIQSKKFDPQNKYVKKWVPELGTMKEIPPIVDHKTARVRALRAYKGE